MKDTSWCLYTLFLGGNQHRGVLYQAWKTLMHLYWRFSDVLISLSKRQKKKKTLSCCVLVLFLCHYLNNASPLLTTMWLAGWRKTETLGLSKKKTFNWKVLKPQNRGWVSRFLYAFPLFTGGNWKKATWTPTRRKGRSHLRLWKQRL